MQPDEALGGRGIECARGKVVGGSSSVNAMTYTRGHRSDYDRWAEAGLPGWSYDSILPYFRLSETWDGGSDAFRGGNGPLRVEETRYRDPLLQSVIAAGVHAGHQTTSDYNGAQQDGFALIQQTIHKGRRCSAATAYLRPALKRKNLRVVVEAQVERVILEDACASGIIYSRRGERRRATARREVVLCAGVLDTPKLLMLSGIGDPEQLAAHGIGLRVASPGVGCNFQDHLSVLVKHRRLDQSTFQREMRYDRLTASMMQAWAGSGGFAGDVPIGLTAFLSTCAGLIAPDVQLLFLAAPFPARPYLWPLSGPVPDGYACRVALLRPKSRGRVTLESADPAAAPVITPNFLSDPADMKTLLDGIRLLRTVFAQSEMAKHDGGEIAPGPDVTTDEDLTTFIRQTSSTVHHPAGTCRMGPQGEAGRVVDPDLRVCGVKRLRVVDASVMPDLVGGNINGVVMAIAERAADLIRGHSHRSAANASVEARIAEEVS